MTGIDVGKLREAVAGALNAEQGLLKVGRCAARLSETELTELVLSLPWEPSDAHGLPETIAVYLALVPSTVRDRVELAVFRSLFSLPPDDDF